MTALEYGAGTGITSFLLKDHLAAITMMDNSPEMVKIMNEKITGSGTTNLKAVFFDLEKTEWKQCTFDLIFNQMVLHHVIDIDNITGSFFRLLNPGSYLAIADLYPEDGSFHGNGFKGHKGFDPDELSAILAEKGFTNISYRKCFEIFKNTAEHGIKQFDIFLLIAGRGN